MVSVAYRLDLLNYTVHHRRFRLSIVDSRADGRNFVCQLAGTEFAFRFRVAIVPGDALQGRRPFFLDSSEALVDENGI
jgi:hypothetical protein